MIDYVAQNAERTFLAMEQRLPVQLTHNIQRSRHEAKCQRMCITSIVFNSNTFF
jgi:hypothetical protein